MRFNIWMVVLICCIGVAILAPAPAAAWPWHWCYNEYIEHPAELNDPHEVHGGNSCGNQDSEGETDHGEQSCEGGCDGSFCGLGGPWSTHMHCETLNGVGYCYVEGTINCNGSPIWYFLDCSLGSSFPIVSSNRTEARCGEEVFNCSS